MTLLPWKDEGVYSSKQAAGVDRAPKTLSFMERYIAHNESRKNVEEM
jgi:hypothetical protein